MSEETQNKYVVALSTHHEPGLTKGNKYRVVGFGFYQGAYRTIINDRGEKFSIYDPKKYLRDVK